MITIPDAIYHVVSVTDLMLFAFILNKKQMMRVVMMQISKGLL